MSRQSKQVIVIRKDLSMRKGKIASQCAHASMKLLLDMMERTHTVTHARRFLVYEHSSALADWLDGIFTKITVSVDSEEALLAVHEQAKAVGLPTALIQDVGKTEFGGVPTYTAVAVGPAWADEVDPITGKLPLL